MRISTPPQWQLKPIPQYQFERKKREGEITPIPDGKNSMNELRYAMHLSRIKPEEILERFRSYETRNGKIVILYEKHPMVISVLVPYDIKTEQLKKLLYRVSIANYETEILDYYQTVKEAFLNVTNGYPIQINPFTIWLSSKYQGSINIGHEGEIIRIMGWFYYFDNFPTIIGIDRKNSKVYAKIGEDIWEMSLV